MITCWISMLFAFLVVSSISLCIGSKDDKNFTNIFLISNCHFFNLHVNFSEADLSNFWKNVVFWVETQCSLVGGYECFWGSLWLHHQGWIFNPSAPSTLRVRKVYFFEILVCKYQTTWCHMSEDYNSVITVKVSNFTVCSLQRIDANTGWLITQWL